MPRAAISAIIPAAALALSAAYAAPAPTPARCMVEAVVIEGLPTEAELPDIPDELLFSIPLGCDAAALGRAVRAWAEALADNGYPYSRIATSIHSRIIPHKGGGRGGDGGVYGDYGDDGVDGGDVRDSGDGVDDGDDGVDGGDSGDGGSADGLASVSDTLMTVYLSIEPDERVCMGTPIIFGVSGQKKIFYRDLRFTPGDLYSASAVGETVSRLSSRPYVREATASSPIIIGDAPLCRDSLQVASVAFSVAERREVAVEGALGYESGRGGAKGKLNGRLGLSFINTLGRGESATASYSGTSSAQRLSASAALPWPFGLPIEAGAELTAEVEDGGYGFLGGALSASVDIGPRARGGVALTASEAVPPDSVGAPYTFYGADVFLSLNQKPLERGAVVPELSARAGSGAANREKSYARSKMEASAGIHYPIFKDYALLGRLCAKSLITDEEYLPPAEMYRMGGHGSLRGYSEEEFAFRTAAFFQAEALYYFNRASSVFVFMDGGLGFDAGGYLLLSEAKRLLGYGAGIRFPSRIGPVSIEWARNIGDGWSLGRVHVGVRAGVE